MDPTNSLSHQFAGSLRPAQAKSLLIWGVNSKTDRESGKEGETEPIITTRNRSRESQSRMARKDGTGAESTQGDPDVA